jgi:ubiquinone/menaquinone biosynthesis C-methylase UbiE
MNDYFYEKYRLADFYDDQYNRFTHDIQFWVNYAKNAKNILEIACGTGRITKDLVKLNSKITAFDYSEEMLEEMLEEMKNKFKKPQNF